MDARAQGAQQRMADAARNLHYYSDLLIEILEGQPVLKDESAEGDEARAAMENARKWRSLCEQGD